MCEGWCTGLPDLAVLLKYWAYYILKKKRLTEYLLQIEKCVESCCRAVCGFKARRKSSTRGRCLKKSNHFLPEPWKEKWNKSSFTVPSRTWTSACPCRPISEFPTATWKSCSLEARHSTSRSAGAPAEPRWSVYRDCTSVPTPYALCAGYRGNSPSSRLIRSCEPSSLAM